jgi:hypothetical protein
MSDDLTPENAIVAPIDSYDIISIKVFEEERRLKNLLIQNAQLIPTTPKKTQCSLEIDTAARKYFESKNNPLLLSFRDYISERRESSSSTTSVVQQCCQFVSYLKITLKSNKEIEIPNLLIDVVLNHSLLFHQYFQYLRDHGLKTSTILIRVNSIYHLTHWMRLTRTQHFTEFSHVIDRLIIDRNRYNAISNIDQKSKTLETLIDKRQWVEGGLPALQAMMVDSFHYFDALVSLTKYQQLTSHQYSWSLGFTLATFWVYGINARAQSIESMTRKHFEEIQQSQFHLSSNFKTSSTYGYQIVAATDILRFYVKHIRKQRIPEEVDSDEATLFPSYLGTPLTKGEANRKVHLIFEKYGYDLSITKLRDMLSTHIEELYKSGTITQEGNYSFLIINTLEIEYFKFVTVGQTHSMQTHQRFYVKQSLEKKRKYEEGKNMQNLFENLLHEHPLPSTSIEAENSEEDSSPIDTPSNLPVTPFNTTITSGPTISLDEIYEFGTARSDLNKKGKRFEWTEKEISHLQHFILNVEPTLSESERKNKYAACLLYLKRADSSIQQDFHPFHCENSGRIKTGYEVASKRII